MEVIAKIGQSGWTWSIRAALKLLLYVSLMILKIVCAVELSIPELKLKDVAKCNVVFLYMGALKRSLF